jgi:ribosomal protein S18 acetylase RimI-like enzyme
VDHAAAELSVPALHDSSRARGTGGVTTIATITAAEIAPAAGLFVRAFPRIVRRLFADDGAARRFYADLLELMRRRHGETFFAARAEDGTLAGYLTLVPPGETQAHWRQLARMCGRLLTGAYGAPLRVVRRALSRALTTEPIEMREARRTYPLVYVVALDEAWTGRGVGTLLMDRARQACAGRWNGIWLLVERENDGAIRFYERQGFRRIAEHEGQLAMLWQLAPSST